MAAATSIEPLTPTQRQRGLATLFLTTFISWAGFLLVIPLVAVHFVDDFGWAAATVGLMLAIRQFCQQGTAFAFGAAADRIGPKPLMVAGMLVRGIGFAAMGFAASIPMMLIAMVLSGLGGALFESPNSAALATIVQPEDRQRVYSLLGVIGGIGMVVGTQLGAFLITYDFRLVCLASAAGYVVVGIVVALVLPRLSVSTAQTESRGGIRHVLRDRVFMRYVVLLVGFWFSWSQFHLSMTLAATEITGTSRAVSWIYLVNTSIVIGLGFVLPRLLERWWKPIDLLSSGTLLLGGGLAVIGLANGLPGVLLAAAVFSVGVVLARPGQETVTANLASPAMRGTYFGVAMMSLAIGGGFGNLLGGMAYDFGHEHNLEPIVGGIFLAVAAASAAGLFLNRRTFSEVRTEAVVVASPEPTIEVAAVPAGATAGH
jgi:DHA1 family multidrug resistance protein-like MFS transporter